MVPLAAAAVGLASVATVAVGAATTAVGLGAAVGTSVGGGTVGGGTTAGPGAAAERVSVGAGAGDDPASRRVDGAHLAAVPPRPTGPGVVYARQPVGRQARHWRRPRYSQRRARMVRPERRGCPPAQRR